MTCFKTLIDKIANYSFKSEKYLLCKFTTNEGRSIPTENCLGKMKSIGKQFQCEICKRKVTNHAPYISFDIVSQIQIISSLVTIDTELLSGEPLEIQLHLTCDEIPLSGSSSTKLVPIIIYINNFNNILTQAKYYVVASIFISNKNQKIHYPTLFNPLIEELAHKRYFATHWAAKCYLKIISFIADTPCRAAILNMKQHNGDYPCHKCKISYTNLRQVEDTRGIVK